MVNRINHHEENINVTEMDNLNISFDSVNDFTPLHSHSSTAQEKKIYNPAYNQTKLIVNHYLKHNQSYKGLEGIAQITNMVENASIHVPDTKYKIMKLMDPNYKTEFNIRCTVCQKYTSTNQTKTQCECCGKLITTSNSKYFIYIPIEQQLRNSIHDHWDEIIKNRISEENTISDVHDAIQYKKIAAKYDGSIVLSLVACTDGAAVFKNNSQSFWAIQLYQNYLSPSMRYTPKNVLVVAFFCDSEKPKMKDLFKPLLVEMKSINIRGGFNIQKAGKNLTFMPLITHFCADLPAKADVQAMKTFAGFNGCGYCFHPGVSVKENKNGKRATTYVRYIKRKTPEKLRTHTDMIETYRKIRHASTPIDGIKEISCMIAAPEFDLVSGFAIDYMHCVLLGSTKKLLNLWLDSSNHGKNFYLKPANQKILSERIKKIKPISEITRKPGPISKRAEYKANEFRTLLLYYLRFCLSGLLNKIYIDHFQLLSSSIYCLLKDKIPIEDMLDAEKKLNRFVDEFETLYGANNVTFNIHLTRHIVDAVRNLGPLWAQSAFAFEANNAILTKTTSKNAILHSITWKYKARCSSRAEENIENDTSDILLKGKQIINLNKDDEIVFTSFGLKIEQRKAMTIYNRAIAHKKLFTSEKCNEISTIDFFVELKSGEIGSIMFYFIFDYIFYAYIDIYGITKATNHLLEVERLNVKKIFKIEEFKKKMIFIKIGNREVLTSRPNIYEKS